MAAKKNIIKDLRQEIVDLEDKIRAQVQHINHREKMYARAKAEHAGDLAMINRQTNNVARTLKREFSKELTWLELCDDPESKMQIVKGVIETLQWIAKLNNE